MLNYEYARLVEQDRRREIAARIRVERALHPDDPGVDGRVVHKSMPGRTFTSARGVASPTR
jgi:hypothetical protein